MTVSRAGTRFLLLVPELQAACWSPGPVGRRAGVPAEQNVSITASARGAGRRQLLSPVSGE